MAAVGKRPFQSMLDLGTGTGRLLELFAPLLSPRRRHRPVARNAGGGARQSRPGRRGARAGSAGRHFRAAGRARQLRPDHHAPGAALSGRARRPRSARRRGCCARRVGLSSSISRRMRWNSCATSTRICGSAFPTSRSPNGSQRRVSTVEVTKAFEPRGAGDATLTVKLWLGRDRRLLIADRQNQALQGEAA